MQLVSILALQKLSSANPEASIFTSVTDIRPELLRFMFKIFKAFVPKNIIATMQQLVFS